MSGAFSLGIGKVDRMRRANILSEGRVGWVDPRVGEGGEDDGEVYWA